MHALHFSGSEQFISSDPEPEPSEFDDNTNPDITNLFYFPADRVRSLAERPVRQETIETLAIAAKGLIALCPDETDAFVYVKQLSLPKTQHGDLLLLKYDTPNKAENAHAFRLRADEPESRVVSMIFRLPPVADTDGHEVFLHESYDVVKDDESEYRITHSAIDSASNAEKVRDVKEAEAAQLLSRLRSL